MSETFGQILQRWMTHAGVTSDDEGGARLGLGRTRFNRYKNDAVQPSYEKLRELLPRMGGDFDRCLPWYNPATECVQSVVSGTGVAEEEGAYGTPPPPALAELGHVDARSGRVEYTDPITAGAAAHPAEARLFAGGPLWAATAGPPWLLEVRGDDMAQPVGYADGDRLVMRAWVQGARAWVQGARALGERETAVLAERRATASDNPDQVALDFLVLAFDDEAQQIISLPVRPGEKVKTMKPSAVRIRYAAVGLVRR